MHEQVEHGAGRSSRRPAGGGTAAGRRAGGGCAVGTAGGPLRARGRCARRARWSRPCRRGPAAGAASRSGGAGRPSGVAWPWSDGWSRRCRPGRACWSGRRCRVGLRVRAPRGVGRRRDRHGRGAAAVVVALGLLARVAAPGSGPAASGRRRAGPGRRHGRSPGDRVGCRRAGRARRPGAELAAVAERIVADNALGSVRLQPGQVLRVPAADALRTPARKGVPLVPRSGRHADRWRVPLPLPLHVVVTSCCSSIGGDRLEQRRRSSMRCPFCRHSDCRVIDSREVDDGQATRRRRSCAACGRRFTTVEEAVLAVVKRSGVTEPFSRDKVVSGVRRACQGRPVDEDALAAARAPGRGGGPRRRHGRGPQPRGRAGHPRPAARARRGGLPALRERLPLVLLDRGLREGDRRSRDGAAGRRGPASADRRPRRWLHRAAVRSAADRQPCTVLSPSTAHRVARASPSRRPRADRRRGRA